MRYSEVRQSKLERRQAASSEIPAVIKRSRMTLAPRKVQRRSRADRCGVTGGTLILAEAERGGGGGRRGGRDRC